MCLTLCNFMNYSPWEFHGILQARILEWVANSISRESSQPRDQTRVSCTAGRFFTIWVTMRNRNGLIFYFVTDSPKWDPLSSTGGGGPSARGVRVYVRACSVTQSCLTLCGPMDCSLPGSSGDGISQAGMLEWVAMSCSRGSYWPRDQHECPALAGGIFTAEPPGKSLCRVWRVPVECALEDTVSSENPSEGCWMWFLSTGDRGCSHRTGSSVLPVAQPQCHLESQC